MNKFIRVGDMLPDVSFPDLGGNQVSLSSFRGERLLLFMWSSW